MKIRSGFVSNSSSQSFLIYGICMPLKDMPVFKGKEELTWQEEDLLDKALEADGLELRHPPDGTPCIGRSWSQVADNQTGAEFKREVEALIAKHTAVTSGFGTLEAAWYDG